MSMSDKKIVFLFRALTSLIFIGSGLKHLFDPDSIAMTLETSSWKPYLETIMPLKAHAFAAGIALFSGGLGLLLGFYVRWSALILIFVLIPITLSVQLKGAETMGPFLKNLAILGSLIYFSRFGTEGSLLADTKLLGISIRNWVSLLVLGFLVIISIKFLFANLFN